MVTGVPLLRVASAGGAFPRDDDGSTVNTWLASEATTERGGPPRGGDAPGAAGTSVS